MINKKIISKLIILVFIFNLFSNLVFNRVYADSNLSGVTIDEAAITIDGKEINTIVEPLKQDALVELSYTWKIANTADITTGAAISIDLPEALDYGTDLITGDLSGVGGSYGTWTVYPATKILKLVMSEKPSIESNVQGTVKLKLKFNIDKMIVDVPYIMSIPLSVGAPKTYTINFEVPEVPDVAKSGMQSSTDANVITWKVDINKNRRTVNSAVVIDSIDSLLDYEEGSMKIYPLTVKSNGSVVQASAPIASDLYELVYDAGGKQLSVTFNLAINSAYRLVYDTRINAAQIDTSKTTFEYSNAVTFNGASDTAKVTITRGPLIVKDGQPDLAFNANKITWSINVNKALYPLKNVNVEDNIPSGLTLDASSIKVYKMPGKDLVTTENLVSINTENNKFTVNLGNITEEYLVEYDTAITSAAKLNNNTSISFKNNAIIYQGIDGNVVTNTVTKTVKVNKGATLIKSRVADIRYDDDKYITWTVDVNLSEINLGTHLYSDAIGDWQKLDTGYPIEVYPLIINHSNTSGNVTQGEKLSDTEYTLSLLGATPIRDFSIDFKSDITSAYRIVYRTIITDKQTHNFINDGYIGVNDGTPDVKNTFPITISNQFSKSNTGINYSTKVLGWELTVNPIQKAINDLVITDTLNPELMMTNEQFDALNVKRGSDLMNKGTDYTITKTMVGLKIKGFIINFTAVVNQAEYTVDYETVMDPDVLSNDGNLTYLNKALYTFAGHPEQITIPIIKTPTIPDIAKHNGSKSGTMDAANKKINWTINTNHLSKNINGLELTDAMLGNQKLVAGSIKIYNYSLNPAGVIILGDPVDTSVAGFVITEASDQSNFKITYPTNINKPYRITYSTEFVGISQTVYSNTAVTNKNESYSATVPYADGDKFVSKIGTLNGIESVDWKVTMNKSQSTISSYTLTDTLSEGLKLIEDSFIIKKLDGTVVPFDSMLTLNVRPRVLATDPQVFDLVSKASIAETYTVEYRTNIILDEILENKVFNNVTFKGEQVLSGVRQQSVTISHSFVTGSGTGTGEVGSFVLRKVNEQGVPLQGVKFEFYKGAKLLGILVTDVNGEASASRLKYAAYSVKEIGELNGYQVINENINFTVANTTQQIITVINHKLRTLEIIKTRKDKPTELLANAVFEIRGASDVLLYTVRTDSNGKTNVQLPYGTYKVKEITAPAGYTKDDKESTVIIAEGDLQEDKSLKMIYTVSFENERIIYPPYIPEIATVGDYVWYDKNGDGIQDTTEKGISDVKVTLTDAQGRIITTLTDNLGKYIFDNLFPGSYTVSIDKTTLPKDLKETYELDKTLDGKVAVTLVGGKFKDDVDFGYNKNGVGIDDDVPGGEGDFKASLGDYVWYDKNGNGKEELNEKGIAGVKIILTDSKGTSKTTTTDNLGWYIFENLSLGKYTVTIDKTTLPKGFKETYELDKTLDGKVVVTLITAEFKDDVDFGYNKNGIGIDDEDVPEGNGDIRASLGDYVWYDKNGNGKQESNEKGIAGVKLILTDSYGNKMTTATDSLGKYIFKNLPIAKYIVTIDKTTLPKGMKETYELDKTLDGKVVVTLIDAKFRDDVDFGYNKNGVGIEDDMTPGSPSDQDINPLPKTGTENYNLLLSGILMLLLSSGFIMFYRRKES